VKNLLSELYEQMRYVKMESAIKKLKDGKVIYLTPKEKEWLIEQAEKVEHLEKELKLWQDRYFDS
jgi:hypothetical protein